MPKRRASTIALLTGLACVALLTLLGAKLWEWSQRSRLSGTWSMVLPAGHVFEFEVHAEGGGRWRFEKARNFSGLYEEVDGRLEVREPLRKNLTEFVWKIREDGTLELITAPSTGKTGADYRGSVMRRPESIPKTR